MIQTLAIPMSIAKAAFILSICVGFALFSSKSAVAGVPPAAPANDQASSDATPLEVRLLQEGLVDVQLLDPSIRVDLKYANAGNFMEANVYGELTRAYLRPSAAAKLIQASAILQERHPELRLVVIDAVRPRSVQHKMWEIVADTPKQRYVANPYHGSMHNYGTAVDVTLYCTETERPLDMGTIVDHFGPLAHPNLEHKFLQEGRLDAQQIENRLILRNAMQDAGWIVLPIEWWHFDAFPTDYTRRTYSIIE